VVISYYPPCIERNPKMSIGQFFLRRIFGTPVGRAVVMIPDDGGRGENYRPFTTSEIVNW
jgi:hypothetical protein